MCEMLQRNCLHAVLCVLMLELCNVCSWAGWHLSHAVKLMLMHCQQAYQASIELSHSNVMLSIPKRCRGDMKIAPEWLT